MPRCSSSRPSTRPTGPPPAIRTGVWGPRAFIGPTLPLPAKGPHDERRRALRPLRLPRLLLHGEDPQLPAQEGHPLRRAHSRGAAFSRARAPEQWEPSHPAARGPRRHRRPGHDRDPRLPGGALPRARGLSAGPAAAVARPSLRGVDRHRAPPGGLALSVELHGGELRLRRPRVRSLLQAAGHERGSRPLRWDHRRAHGGAPQVHRGQPGTVARHEPAERGGAGHPGGPLPAAAVPLRRGCRARPTTNSWVRSSGTWPATPSPRGS